jgi:hypothetical protein
LHGILDHGDSFLIDRAAQFDDGMNAFPGHALGRLQHRLGVGELGTVSVLFQDSPATLHRIVFAVIGRIVQEADAFADVIGKLDDSLEKLRTPTIALRSVIRLDLVLLGMSFRQFPAGLRYLRVFLLPQFRTAAECVESQTNNPGTFLM